MSENSISVASLDDKKMTWSDIIGPKIGTSNPKYMGRAKAIAITEVDELGQPKLNSLSIEKVLTLYNLKNIYSVYKAKICFVDRLLGLGRSGSSTLVILCQTSLAHTLYLRLREHVSGRLLELEILDRD
jgi:hypothetical protein